MFGPAPGSLPSTRFLRAEWLVKPIERAARPESVSVTLRLRPCYNESMNDIHEAVGSGVV